MSIRPPTDNATSNEVRTESPAGKTASLSRILSAELRRSPRREVEERDEEWNEERFLLCYPTLMYERVPSSPDCKWERWQLERYQMRRLSL